MNERIKDLALECIVENIASPCWVFTNAEFEKFAELVVADCIAICISNALDDLDTDNPRGASAKCAFDIKKHFGVEE